MGCRVLVADDEAYITTVVARKLENAGLEVIVAMDGQE
ncbi:MAG: DNA-binding response regulator, partial [Planctomycetes bacterium]|nr:DNA-binding response regulator [Planctomycetota bacterium]